MAGSAQQPLPLARAAPRPWAWMTPTLSAPAPGRLDEPMHRVDVDDSSVRPAAVSQDAGGPVCRRLQANQHHPLA